MLIVDSTEKCAGTSIKRYLRFNFSRTELFDLDNGDPPEETIRSYGIDCPIHFPVEALAARQENFYDIYHQYINHRADWFMQRFDTLTARCVYGNGIAATPLLEFFRERGVAARICKFFRSPINRVSSEFEYVRHFDEHNLHPIAKECRNLADYVRHPDRPRNRMVYSVTGRAHSDGLEAASEVLETYFYFGFVENFSDDVLHFLRKNGLTAPETEIHGNKTATGSLDKTVADPALLSALIAETDHQDQTLYEVLRKSRGLPNH